VLAWALSNMQEMLFCLDLHQALEFNTPEIFNTDSENSIYQLGIYSNPARPRYPDQHGRALDTIFVERLWRTVKYENIYLNDYQSVLELRLGLQQYFEFYNQQRLHRSPDYQTSADASSLFWKVCF
jgi:putative transposase